MSFGQLSAQTSVNEVIVNSIKDYIEVIGKTPLFSTKYIKTNDGRDMKYIDYLQTELEKSKTEGNDFYLAKALAYFGSINASLSKNSAKRFGIQNNNTSQIQSEYYKYFSLNRTVSTINLSNRNDYINLYLNSIRSISFFFKVQGIPVYEEVEKNINYKSDYISSIDKDPRAFKASLTMCHLLFAQTLEDYAKFIVIAEVKKDISDFPFAELSANLSAAIALTFDSEEIDKEIGEIIKGYFFIINSELDSKNKE